MSCLYILYILYILGVELSFSSRTDQIINANQSTSSERGMLLLLPTLLNILAFSVLISELSRGMFSCKAGDAGKQN